MVEERFVLVQLESENIVHDDDKDVQIEDCKKPALGEHLDIILSTEGTEHQGVVTGIVWSGQEWKKYV